MPIDNVDEELLQLIDNMACHCGIPRCLGHEDKGDYIEFTAAELELLKRSWEADSASQEDSNLK